MRDRTNSPMALGNTTHGCQHRPRHGPGLQQGSAVTMAADGSTGRPDWVVLHLLCVFSSIALHSTGTVPLLLLAHFCSTYLVLAGAVFSLPRRLFSYPLPILIVNIL